MEPDATSLLVLNDDCLDNIFVYFNLDELMKIYGSVHSVIDAAIERQLHKFTHINFSLRFPPQYDDNQKQVIGKYLHSMNINVGYSMRDTVKVLEPFFVGAKKGGRLKAVKIQYTDINSQYLEMISMVKDTLIELDLTNCDVLNRSELMLLLKSAPKLKMLALVNIDAGELDESQLSSLDLLKVNWIVGTKLFDVFGVRDRYPNLSMTIYQAEFVDWFGPPAARYKSYFQDI